MGAFPPPQGWRSAQRTHDAVMIDQRTLDDTFLIRSDVLRIHKPSRFFMPSLTALRSNPSYAQQTSLGTAYTHPCNRSKPHRNEPRNLLALANINISSNEPLRPTGSKVKRDECLTIVKPLTFEIIRPSPHEITLDRHTFLDLHRDGIGV